MASQRCVDRKQHYDKSPNCPFFTETIERQATDGDLPTETGVDDTVSISAAVPVRTRIQRLLV